MENEEIAGHLYQDTSVRLKKNTRALTEAHDRDLVVRQQRQAVEESRQRETAALAFTTGFRPRLETSDATHGDIASAETDGMLSPARADNLSTELAGHMSHMETLSGRA